MSTLLPVKGVRAHKARYSALRRIAYVLLVLAVAPLWALWIVYDPMDEPFTARGWLREMKDYLGHIPAIWRHGKHV